MLGAPDIITSEWTKHRELLIYVMILVIERARTRVLGKGINNANRILM